MSHGLHLLVPGPLHRRSGGTIYDARMLRELTARGYPVRAHELPGDFPTADTVARAALDETLRHLPDGDTALIDGLALGDSPDIAEHHATRLRLLALVHHPLADEHGLDDGTRERFLEREIRALAACRGVIVTSPFTARRVAALGVPPARVTVAEPGTDPADPATGPGDGAAPELLCVASLTPRKGQDVLVEALAGLAHLRWTATLAGPTDTAPAYADAVRRQIADAGLEQRIRCPGSCDDHSLTALYRRASIFVLPSRYEGYGMVLTEALARGLPVISTTGGAIPDTVPAAAAHLVPPGDATALAAALEDWLRHPAARARAAAAAWTHGRQLMAWPQAADRLAAAITALEAPP